MSSQTWWYLSRASGMVAAVMLVASLVWGVLLATRALKPVDRPAWLLSMHRWFSGLAVIGTAVHLGALVADNYTHFGTREILVPMASVWKPGAVTLGVIALYLLVLVEATSLLMKKLPKALWRGVHYSSYLLVWFVAVHAGLAGTDASNRVYQAVALLLTIAAVTATVLRVTMGKASAQRAARAAASAPSAHRPPARPPAMPAPDRPTAANIRAYVGGSDERGDSPR